MKFCQYCGGECVDNAIVCPHCKSKIGNKSIANDDLIGGKLIAIALTVIWLCMACFCKVFYTKLTTSADDVAGANTNIFYATGFMFGKTSYQYIAIPIILLIVTIGIVAIIKEKFNLAFISPIITLASVIASLWKTSYVGLSSKKIVLITNSIDEPLLYFIEWILPIAVIVILFILKGKVKQKLQLEKLEAMNSKINSENLEAMNSNINSENISNLDSIENQPINDDEIAMVQKLKELFDSGALTEEEYEVKKKEALKL